MALSKEILEAADQCPENLDLWTNLAAACQADGMTSRDTRDLLMEYGCPGTTATELAGQD